MKTVFAYECEICGAVHTNKDLIKLCEASHLGLSNTDLYDQYMKLKEDARKAGAQMCLNKNEETEKKLDKACKALAVFETIYNVTKGDEVNGI